MPRPPSPRAVRSTLSVTLLWGAGAAILAVPPAMAAPSSPNSPVRHAPLATDCASRTGGAFVTLTSESRPDVSITLWFTDSAFIDRAIAGKGAHNGIPILLMRTGTDCDQNHAWHVSPVATWADAAREECDGNIAWLDENLDQWMQRVVPDWCPWGVIVTAVDDRRAAPGPGPGPEPAPTLPRTE